MFLKIAKSTKLKMWNFCDTFQKSLLAAGIPNMKLFLFSPQSDIAVHWTFYVHSEPQKTWHFIFDYNFG